jgi:large repetitive protein
MRMLHIASLAALLPSTAWAWPADTDWADLQLAGAALGDAELDVDGPQRVDLVGGTAGAAGAWWTDGVEVYLRLRLNASPASSPQPLNTDNFVVLVDTDGTDTDYELMVQTWAEGATLEIHQNSGGTGWKDPADTGPETVYPGPFSGSRARIVATGDGTGGASGDEDYFLDLAVAWADLASAGGLSISSPMRLAVGTTYDDAFSHEAKTDLAGADNDGAPVLEDVLSDAIIIDADEDGLTVFEEEAAGTDPDLADSDGDGLLDGDELDRGTDPLDDDSDDDGLSDGDEVDLGTDPLDDDSDDDGALDGDEVENGTDPLDEDSDDDGFLDGEELECGGDDPDDRDGDGISDTVEGDGDLDEDDNPDWCDEDDDGDGIPTSVEGTIDTDDDGEPNYQDLDSDDDGLTDREEGVEDGDCDGLANYVDDLNEDGPCGDLDGDGLTNEEEEECGTDPENPDTDGDGLLDGEESCDDDSDGDGVVDVLDDTDDDGDGGGLDDTLPPVSGFTGGDFTGGSCSTLPGLASFGPALLAALAALRRRRRSPTRRGRGALAGLAVAAGAGVSGPAAAQEINAERLRPSVGQSGPVVIDDSAVGPSGAGGALMFTYANDPLVYRYSDGREEVAILHSVGTLHAMPWYTAGPVLVGLDVPLHLFSDGYGVEEVDGRALGDLSLTGRLQLMDRHAGGLGLAAQARLDLPTGAGRAWLGEPGPGVHLQANAAWGERAAVLANIGARIGTTDTLNELTVGNSLTFGAGGWMPFTDQVGASVEVVGERYLGSAEAAGATPVEWIADLRWAPNDRWVANVGGGTGLTQGVGAPDFRVLAGVSAFFGREASEPPPVAAPVGAQVVKPQAPGTILATLRFQTSDGASLSRVRLTLDEGPEVGRYEASDGGDLALWLKPGQYNATVEVPGYMAVSLGLAVPESGAIEKLVALTPEARSCSLLVEVTNIDRAPVVATVATTDGAVSLTTDAASGAAKGSLREGAATELVIRSPSLTTDHRGIACKAGPDGRMPDLALSVVLTAPRARLDGARIRIDDKIHFELDSATIRPVSRGVLDDVADVLIANPKVGTVEIQGHTDIQGDAEHNLALSQTRAEAVRAYLESRGVDASRIQAKGLGEARPIRDGTTDDDHEANRRVEFHILASRPQ